MPDSFYGPQNPNLTTTSDNNGAQYGAPIGFLDGSTGNTAGVITAPPPTTGLNTTYGSLLTPSQVSTDSSFFNATPTSKTVSSSTPAANSLNNLQSFINSQATTNPVQPTPLIGTTGNYSVYDASGNLKQTFSDSAGAQNYIAANPGTFVQNGDSSTTPVDPTQAPYLQDNALIQQQRTSLQQQRDAEIASINQQFDQTQKSTAQAQAQDMGASTRNLLYLQQGGQSASAQAYLNDLSVKHQEEMTALTAKRASAIQAAQNAFSDKDFALAEKLSQNAKDMSNLIYKRTQDFIDNTLKVKQEANQEAQQTYAQQADQRAAAKEIVKFAQDNGLKSDSQFFESGGNIYNSKTGQAFASKAEALAAGVNPDLSNVQQIQKSSEKNYAPGIIGEYQKFMEDVAAGKEKYMTFNQFETLDANRKQKLASASAPRVTYNEQKDQKNDAAVQFYGQKLAARVGADGKVSNQDFMKAYSAWISSGLPGADFYKNFSGLIDYSHASDYGVAKQSIIPGQ